MRLNKRQAFWIVFPIGTVGAVLCALFPERAGPILQDYWLPAVGALMVLGLAWRVGRRPFWLFLLGLLLTAAPALVFRYAVGTIFSVVAGSIVVSVLSVAAVICLAAATVVGIRAFLRDES